MVQDAAQGFHWDNSQCTVHPFVVYFKNCLSSETEHNTYCFLSPCTKHNTTTFYTFLKTLIPTIITNHPKISKIHYFTDGCGGQYKNLYNFSNICNHEKDFGVTCEWHFFATSHGKSACDGVGGAVKRTVAKASLQRSLGNQILTVNDMFNFCIQNLGSKIKFFVTSAEEIEETEQQLKERFEGAKKNSRNSELS